MTKFYLWFKNRMKTDLTPKGLVLRVAADIFLSNLGLFLGIMTTVWFRVFTWTEASQAFFLKMFFQVWLYNVPMLTICCLFSYTINGFYRGITNRPYMIRFFVVTRGVGTAFFIFLFWIYLTDAFMPRSTMVAGWFFIFIIILLSRLSSTLFIRQYNLTSANAADPRIRQIVRELATVSSQDGWLPPENMPSMAAWPYFDDDEIRAAACVLKSGKINQWTGDEVRLFQKEFAEYCGVKYAVALANGTLALELALHVLGIGVDDEVIVTPRTFVASASCIALQGAKPVFVDVDPESQNINVQKIKQAITPRTRAIIAVHLAGWPCDMDPIMKIAKEHNLKVIEDCAQCHGAVYYSKWPGNAQEQKQAEPIHLNGVSRYPRVTGSIGDLAAFSFCQDKIMSTGGEGGMLLMNDEALWQKAWAYKDHGKSYDAVYKREHPRGFRWLHESLGTNWRMTEMQAAIGRQQLKKLPEWVASRKRNAEILTVAFEKIPGLRITQPPANVRHAYYKYYVFIRPEKLKAGWDRDRIMKELTEESIPCFSGSCSEVYLEKAFDVNGARPAERLPLAKELGETSLMFLVHPTLSEYDIQNVVNAVQKVMTNAAI